ncbi:MAG: hypothetical protein IT181_00250 [Acidobacteria bacterium]|nr:hypothetical protein [Acidobacteriota bacterium]
MTDRRFALRLAATTVCGAILASCGGQGATPTAPSSTGTRSGVWQGTLNEASGTTGTLRLTVEERQVDARRSLLTGTWTASYQDRARDGAGSLTGTITDATGTLLLVPSTPGACDRVLLAAAGSYSASELAISAASMRGAYSQLLCTSTITGTLSLTKP